MKNLKIGDRVVLAWQNYGPPDRLDPTIGTEYFCVGTVVKAREFGGGFVLVHWDNGNYRYYNELNSLLMKEW